MLWSVALILYICLVVIATGVAVRMLSAFDDADAESVIDEPGPRYFKPNRAFLHEVAVSYGGDGPDVYYVVADAEDSAIAIARALSADDHRSEGLNGKVIETLACQRLPCIAAIDLAVGSDV